MTITHSSTNEYVHVIFHVLHAKWLFCADIKISFLNLILEIQPEKTAYEGDRHMTYTSRTI